MVSERVTLDKITDSSVGKKQDEQKIIIINRNSGNDCYYNESDLLIIRKNDFLICTIKNLVLLGTQKTHNKGINVL